MEEGKNRYHKVVGFSIPNQVFQYYVEAYNDISGLVSVTYSYYQDSIATCIDIGLWRTFVMY